MTGFLLQALHQEFHMAFSRYVNETGCPIKTLNTPLLFFLVPIAPITNNEFTVKNSIRFTNDICNIRLHHPIYMVSFDVKSLSTNIPLVETINICVEQCQQLGPIPYNLTIFQFVTTRISGKRIIFFLMVSYINRWRG